MNLLTEEVRKALPPLYSQDGKGYDAIAHVKFFDPSGSWTWYATEGQSVDENGNACDRELEVDYLCFGLVDGHKRELGYFSLGEMQGVKGRLGLGIERDLYWKPKPLSEV